MKVLFPHENYRKIQKDFIEDILTALKEKKHLLAHAPTGLGKSAASLATTLPYALENGLTIFFLTSRHTQHKIAIDTLKKIKEKHNVKIQVTDLIGKKHMCLVPGTDKLTSQQFTEYCKEAVENKTCQFYNKLKNGNKLSFETKTLLAKTEKQVLEVDELIEESRKSEVCPYEISILKAKNSNVIIMDYYHIFSPAISAAFLKKTEKILEESIIIVDEAHNLPLRMRDHLSAKLTMTMIERAITEANHYDEAKSYLEQIKQKLLKLAEIRTEEKIIKKKEFVFEDQDKILIELEKIADIVKDIKKNSYIDSVVQFLEMWQGEDEGFARILRKGQYENKNYISITYRCLDPSLLSTDVIDSAHSIICMSGTLTPIKMYSEILGFKNPMLRTYENPFPKKNRLSLLIPKTSTKFTKRSMGMYQDIARECAGIVNTINGNCMIFFPSYQLRDSVNTFFQNLCQKTTYLEHKGISKNEKDELLENFKADKKTGSVLLAVMGGNFSEGIDLPGDLLKGVVVVGLALSKPDLETQELINYFDRKYSKGWDYAYIFPAMQKTIQAAGRCIRSETDKGVVVFLDERYAWNNYFKCFPPDFNIHTTLLPLKRIKEFLEEN
jgi:DNA excision repair protein ERCC-2